MPISAVGNRSTRRERYQRGVTLIEVLLVVALIAVVTGLAYPSVTSGLEALRMRQTSDQVVKFLSSALDRADRRQQVVEVRISPTEGTMTARSQDLGYNSSLVLPAPIRIAAITPVLASGDPDQPRRFLLYPGGAVPRVTIEIAHPAGRRRVIGMDPLTGTARAEIAP